ncbi:ABC transporter permease [uncultured Devosia sp.]|uniref:ABC transporter permease n=1 Tax=uncultured Devosia sp. TaxID=211434 RepID=UPI0035C98ED1
MPWVKGSIRFNLSLALPSLVLALLVALIVGFYTPSFLLAGNLGNLVNRVVPLGLVALGEAMVLFAGRIDLSLGAIMSLATALMATLSVQIGWLAIPVALAGGALCGLFTAAGIVLLRVNPLIMTLATSAVVKGVTLLILPSPGGEVDYTWYELFFGMDEPLGLPLYLILSVFLIAFVVLGWTRFGRTLYAMGSDERSAYANGVNVRLMDVAVFTLAGMLAASAGIVMSIRILSGDPLIGDPYTLDAIAAAVLGGVALKGGRGNVLGVLFGVVALVLISNAFNLLEIDTNIQAIVKGLIFVLALVFFMRGKAGEIA